MVSGRGLVLGLCVLVGTVCSSTASFSSRKVRSSTGRNDPDLEKIQNRHARHRMVQSVNSGIVYTEVCSPFQRKPYPGDQNKYLECHVSGSGYTIKRCPPGHVFQTTSCLKTENNKFIFISHVIPSRNKRALDKDPGDVNVGDISSGDTPDIISPDTGDINKTSEQDSELPGANVTTTTTTTSTATTMSNATMTSTVSTTVTTSSSNDVTTTGATTRTSTVAPVITTGDVIVDKPETEGPPYVVITSPPSETVTSDKNMTLLVTPPMKDSGAPVGAIVGCIVAVVVLAVVVGVIVFLVKKKKLKVPAPPANIKKKKVPTATLR